MNSKTDSHRKNSVRSRQRKRLAYYSLFLFLLSLSFVLMPIEPSVRITASFRIYPAGILFWIGLLGSLHNGVPFCKAYDRPIKGSSKASDFLLRFFQNPLAKIFDWTFLLSLPIFLLSLPLCKKQYFPFSILAIVIYSFGMHIVLNSTAYVRYRSSAFKQKNLRLGDDDS